MGDLLLESVRVVVVDDDDDVRKLLGMVLHACGATVWLAASAADGFAAVEQAHPQVIVSDIEMPREDGLAFIRRLRRTIAGGLRNIPAIALTGLLHPSIHRLALEAGYTRLLSKPVNIDTLRWTIRELADLLGP